MTASGIGHFVSGTTRFPFNRNCSPWSDTWDMQFNAKRCYIMHISRSTSPLTNFCSLCNQMLQSVDDVKYLGVTLTSELSWSPHKDHITHRANSTLRFLRRNLKRCPSKLKETAYLSSCRSVLEYAASMWDPFLSKDKNSLYLYLYDDLQIPRWDITQMGECVSLMAARWSAGRVQRRWWWKRHSLGRKAVPLWDSSGEKLMFIGSWGGRHMAELVFIVGSGSWVGLDK